MTSSNNQIRFDSSQREAVTSAVGPVLIEGGPSTGKAWFWLPGASP